MIRIYRAASLPDAHLLRALLVQLRIDACVFNEHAQAGAGELPLTEVYPEVWLMDGRDLERAREVIREFEAPEPVRAPRHCSACGEGSPGNFQVCWNCAGPL